MFYFETNGTPYEIGVQTGKSTALAIGSMVDYVLRAFGDWDEKKFQQVRSEHMAYTEKIFPELIEEIEGIAHGSGFPFQTIYLLNFYAVMHAGNEQCTNIIFPDTPDGPLLGKTNDLPLHEGHHSGVRKTTPENAARAMLSGTFPGTVWCAPGMNAAGLAVGGSSCSTRVPAPSEVLSPHVVARYLLSRAETVADAVKLLEEITIPRWGLNIPLVDKTGAAAIVEKSGTYQGVRWSSGEPIYCANYSCTAQLAPFRENKPLVMAESMARVATIEKHLAGKKPGAQLMREILSQSKPFGAISRHGSQDPLGYETEFACIFHPAQSKAQFCFSHPDRDPWREFTL